MGGTSRNTGLVPLHFLTDLLFQLSFDQKQALCALVGKVVLVSCLAMATPFHSQTWSSETLLRGISLVANQRMELASMDGITDAFVADMESELEKLQAHQLFVALL